ncbi:uncharacterized protein [Chaetodon trifascialis]|uniref:uncharacterized protein n=1 Tax=Chaetodon trifascialis TaxID=109706 RepID=UPI0039964507
MFSAALMLLLAAGSCVNSIDLIQPDSMVVQSGQSLTIICQVSGYSLTDNSYATGWIRQCEGKPMDWILHRWGGGGFYQNNGLKNKFIYHTRTSTSSVTLTGHNLQPEDTAVYYCSPALLLFSQTAQGQSLTSSEPVVSRAGEPVTQSCKVEGLAGLAALGFVRNQEQNWNGLDALMLELAPYLPKVSKAVSGVHSTSLSTSSMFSVALLLLLAAGCVKCEQLTQPASVTVQPGHRLTITCQVSYSVSSYYTAWIRQPAGKGLEWMSSDTDVKDSLKNKFSISLDSSSKTFTLNGQNVQPEDTAVYYCARRDTGMNGRGTSISR